MTLIVGFFFYLKKKRRPDGSLCSGLFVVTRLNLFCTYLDHIVVEMLIKMLQSLN